MLQIEIRENYILTMCWYAGVGENTHKNKVDYIQNKTKTPYFRNCLILNFCFGLNELITITEASMY